MAVGDWPLLPRAGDGAAEQNPRGLFIFPLLVCKPVRRVLQSPAPEHRGEPQPQPGGKTCWSIPRGGSASPCPTQISCHQGWGAKLPAPPL